MGNVTSTLTMRLVDGVSGVAPKVVNGLNRVDGAAKRVKGGALGRAGLAAGMAGGGSLLMGAAATYLTAGAVKSAYTDAAAFDRHITRILITADAAQGMATQTKKVIKDVATETATPIEKVTSGLDALVSAGRSLPEALSFLPAVTRTAAASGADVADIARTADALGTSLKITGADMQGAFDILVAGGKAGKFELKDMAAELPSLAAAAKAAGLKGKDGLRQLVAMLQIIRTESGTSGEAATSMGDIFNKMESQETTNKFKKFGIDLRKEMEKARKSGKNLLDVFLDLSKQAVKGDLSKLPQLFQDKEFVRGMRALLGQADAVKKLQGELNNVDGSTLTDLKRVTDDSQAAVDRLANSWAAFVRSTATAADKSGIPKFLETTARELEAVGSMMEKLQNGDYKGAGKAAADFLAYGALPEKDLAAIKAEEDRKTKIGRVKTAEDARAKFEAARDEAYAKYDSVHKDYVGFINHLNQKQTVSDGERAVASQLYSDLKGAFNEYSGRDAMANAAREAVNRAVQDLLPPLPQGPTGLPPELGGTSYDFVPGHGLSGATRPRPTYDVGNWKGRKFSSNSLDAPQAMMPVTLDQESLSAAAKQAYQQFQALMNANPVTIPVRAGDVSGAMGKAVSDGLAGAQSDTAAGRR